MAVGVGVGVAVTVTMPTVVRVLVVVSVTVACSVTVTGSAVELNLMTVVAEGTMFRQWQAEETRDVSYVGGSQSGYSIDRLALFLGVGAAAEAATVMVTISSNTVEMSVTTTVVVSEATLLICAVLNSVRDV